MSRYFIKEQYQQIELKKYIVDLEKKIEICRNKLSELHRLYQNSIIFYSEYQQNIHELNFELMILERNYVDAIYLYECLGDVTVSLEAIKMYYELFHTVGIGIDCDEQKRVVCALYNIICQFSMLSMQAIKEISSFYDSESFEPDDLLDKLNIMIQQNGKTDETFTEFMNMNLLKKKDKVKDLQLN